MLVPQREEGKEYRILGGRFMTSELKRLCSEALGFHRVRSKRTIQTYAIDNPDKVGGARGLENIATYFIRAGFKVPPPPMVRVLKPVDINRVNRLIDIGDKLSEENSKKHNNSAIQKIRMFLDSIGFDYIEEYPVVIERSIYFDESAKLFIIDFYVKYPYNFCLEIDGGYHSTPEQRAYDKARDRSVSGKGMGSTVRITNEEVLSSDFDLLKSIYKKSNQKLRNKLMADFSMHLKSKRVMAVNQKLPFYMMDELDR